MASNRIQLYLKSIIMKKIFILLIPIILLSCNENTTSNDSNNMKSNNIEAKPQIESLDKPIAKSEDALIGVWSLKDFIVNGKEMPKQTKTNIEGVVRFNDDMTMSMGIKNATPDITGKWKRTSENQFIIYEKDEKQTLTILKLTETELHTKMIGDKTEVIIKYTRVK